MAFSNPDASMRVATPELEPEVKPGAVDWLLRQTPKTHRGPRDEAATSPVVPASKPAPTKDEIQARMRQQAQMIDQILHDSDMQDNRQKIMKKQGEFKYLDLRLDITPDHREWQQECARFLNLISTESIQNVLNRNFKPWQQHFLLPPVVAGEILKLQNKNTKKYKEALQGRFSTAKDNIITKLTMVHFGLPVEPLTLNNILHADKDENDAKDAPEEPARVQRIMYAETPLEFLDGYDQRGYGYAMIRRKTNMHLRGAGADKIDLQNADLDDSADENEMVHIRGGAKPRSAPTNDEPEEETEWYLYGTNGRIQMAKKQDSEAFRINASRFLGVSLPQDRPWEFVVDQYKRDNKNQTTVSHFSTGIQGGSFVVSNANYHVVWDAFLKARVFDKFGKWVMVVNTSRNGARAPAKFQIRLEEPPPLLSPKSPVFEESWGRSLLKPSKPTATTAPTDKKTTKGPTRKAYYVLPNEDPVEFEVENDYRDFKSKVRAGLGLAKRDHYHIVFYSKQLDESNSQNQYLYSHFTVSGEGHYAQHIAPKLFGTEDEWIVVAVVNENDAPKDFWPPSSQAPALIPAQPVQTAAEPVGSVPETVPIWHYESERYEVKNCRFNFADVASRALHVDHEPEWTIYIDMYELRFDDSMNEYRRYYDHSGTVEGSFNQPLDSKFTDDFAPKLFDPAQNWGARIRLENEETLPELWFDNFEQHSGILYGYAGQLETTNKYEDFKNAALDLLSLSDDSDWEFTISCPTLQSKHNDVTKSSFQDFFNHILQPILDSNPWRVFVRKIGTAAPKSKEPHLGILSIVRLTLAGRGTAYWKLPVDMVPRYGINQLQEDFFRANRVLFPARLPRPATDVKINFEGVEFNIGFGGMFLTKSLFDALESYIGSVPYARSIELTVTLSPSQITRPFSLRQAGSEIRSRVFDLGHGRNFDLGAVYDEIVRISKQSIELSNENQLPASFRLWRTAEDRESDGPSVLLSYKPENKQQALAKLSDWLEDPFDLRSSCFWFRPEYTSFTVKDVDDPSKPEAVWNAAAGKKQLSGFRSMLDNFFNDGDPASSASFVLEDLQVVDAAQRQRFVISASDTANSPWRRSVLDCLLRNVSFVKRNANINYLIDTSSAWGVTEEAAAPTWSKAPTRAPPPTPPPSTPTTPRGNPGGRQAAASKFNQPRLLKPQAGTPIYSAYKPWIAEQNRQNDKKHRSWSEDISVIEPGQKPEVNIFGTHKELMETISSNFPIHFGQIVTSTDNMKLQEENRQLRMLVLDRIHKCYWCETTFPLYETGKITEHMAQHRAVMEEGGLFCPMCGSEDWIHMNTAQRREHLFKDADAREGQTIKTFWKDQRCLVCDTDLADVKPELVIRHFATHIPGVLKFCDRCGRNEYNFMSEFERMHHDRVCLQSDQAYAEPRVFCNRCGANQTGLSTKKKRKHDKVCSVRDGGKHCYICALDLSPWTTRDERQFHIDNCRSPAGPPRGYCTRCGIDRLNMSALEMAAHEQECYMSEPIKKLQERRARDIDDKWNEMLHQRAKLRKERAQFQQLQDDIWDSEVGPCPHCAGPFAGKDRQYIVDHFRDSHSSQSGKTAAPATPMYQPADAKSQRAARITTPPHSPPGVSQIFCPYAVGLLKCNHVINLPLSEDEASSFIKHVKRDHDVDIYPTEPPKQCPFDLAQGKGKCKFKIRYPLRGDNVDQFYEHYKQKHVRSAEPGQETAVATIACPYRNADGQTVRCGRGPFRLDDGGEDLIHHLRQAHFINGNTEVVCTLDLHDESACNAHVSLHNDAEDLFTHIRDVHPSAPTASHSHTSGGPRTAGADTFTCSLASQSGDKGICGITINTPTTATSRLAFNKHYQHAPGAGGPDSRTVLHVFNEFQRQLQDNLLHARDEHAAIIEEGQDATSIEAEISLIQTELANLAELINDLEHEHEHEHSKSSFADTTQLALDAQTGFEPSPTDEAFPPPTPHPHGRKRKAMGDLPILRRIPGETALQYSIRLKRQRTGPNVVAYAGANEDESARPRGRAVVLKGEKRVEDAGEGDADGGADGEKRKTRHVRITLSQAPKSKKRTPTPAPTLAPAQTQAQIQPLAQPSTQPSAPIPTDAPTTPTTTRQQEQEQQEQQEQGSLPTHSESCTRTRTRTRKRIVVANCLPTTENTPIPTRRPALARTPAPARTNSNLAAAMAAADARRRGRRTVGEGVGPGLVSGVSVGESASASTDVNASVRAGPVPGSGSSTRASVGVGLGAGASANAGGMQAGVNAGASVGANAGFGPVPPPRRVGRPRGVAAERGGRKGK